MNKVKCYSIIALQRDFKQRVANGNGNHLEQR